MTRMRQPGRDCCWARLTACRRQCAALPPAPLPPSRCCCHPLQVCAATHKIAILSGDGIGPEIMAASLQVLTEAGRAEGEEFAYTEALIGGAAVDATGDPYPDATFEICKNSDAVLLACIGGCVALWLQRNGSASTRGAAAAAAPA